MIGFLQKGLLFFVLLVVQVFFIDQLDIGQANIFIAPLVYGLVIISLPPSLEIWLLMVLALIMGLSIDLFRNTIGLNMSSLVMVAFLKNPLLNTIFSKDGYDPLKELNFTTIGWSNFHFSRLHVLLLKALINALISIGFFILVHLITIKRK